MLDRTTATLPSCGARVLLRNGRIGRDSRTNLQLKSASACFGRLSDLPLAVVSDVCRRMGVEPLLVPPDLKVGIASNVRTGLQPVNGLRHLPEDGTTGWFIWAGEQFSEDAGFFVRLHVAHLAEWCPAVLPYLELPPGWRFLIAPGYEDVWQDPNLLDISRG